MNTLCFLTTHFEFFAQKLCEICFKPNILYWLNDHFHFKHRENCVVDD